MHQYLYALAALGLSMILSLNLSNGARRTAQRVYINEAATQLSGVAYDVLEDIERSGIAFDKETDETRHPKPVMFPLVKTSAELTPESEFGGCVDYDACRDIDDFDGLQITRTTQDHTYVVDLSVQYVSESDPTEASPTQTFAKRVAATVSHPAIVINGQPLTVTISRIVTYHRVTEKKGIWL